MRKKPLISHDHAVRVLDDALRLRVGRGKRYSVASVASEAGIAARTIESYMQGKAPGLNALLSLMSVLGPGFTSDVLAPVGMAAREADPSEPEHAKLLAALCAISAELAQSMSDGFVDHREAASLRIAAIGVVEQLDAVIAAGKPDAVTHDSCSEVRR